MKDADWITVITERIVTRFDPLRIILFGSYARGQQNPDSDVDILVVMPEAPDKRSMAIEIRRALSDVPLCKDILVTTPDEIERRGH